VVGHVAHGIQKPGEKATVVLGPVDTYRIHKMIAARVATA